MHPTISDHLVQAHRADLHQHARRHRLAREAREAREARPAARPAPTPPAATVADFGSPDAGRAGFPRSPPNCRMTRWAGGRGDQPTWAHQAC